MKNIISNILWFIEKTVWIAIGIYVIVHLFRCYGATIERVAPDGVNKITVDVDENGYVQSERITLAHVPERYVPQDGDRVKGSVKWNMVNTYQTENPYDKPEYADVKNQKMYLPQSGERVMIGDYEYVIISVGDWTRWTNAVNRLEAVAERRWTREHKTVEGRREWHGNHTNRVVSADGKTVTWFYPDGFEYVENATPTLTRTRPPTAPAKRPPTARLGQSRRIDLPDRLKAKQEAIAKQPPAREVTVTFGPGGKVIGGAQ